MIIFHSHHTSPASQQRGLPVPALPGLVEAAQSLRPEHRAAREAVVEMNWHSRRLADEIREILPDDLREFWEAYSGWFAMYSLAPLLVNERVMRQALAEHPGEKVLVSEDWRSAGWWSGRELLLPAVEDLLREEARAYRASPGPLLRALRAHVQQQAARWQGRRQLAAVEHARRSGRNGGQAAEPVEVLWLSVGAAAVDLLTRLHGRLTEARISQTILDFDYFGSAQALSRRGLPFVPNASLIQAEDLRVARRAFAQMPARWPKIARGFETLPLENLAVRQRELVRERLRLVLQRDAAPWLLQAVLARRALETFAPKVVIGFQLYGPVIAPLIVAADKLGVPSVCLQHGVLSARAAALPCLPYSESLVFGEYIARALEQSRHPKMRLTVTGHALYDEGQRQVQPSEAVLRLREGAEGLVLLCTQFNEPEYYVPERWWMAEVANCCRNLGARLVLKLHPSDTRHTIRLYEQLVRPGDDSVVIVRHGEHPLSELLAACDLMVTRDSTVVFEADLMGKPAVTINLSDREEELPYAQTGGALGVYRHEDICPTLERALRDEETRQALAATQDRFLVQQTGPRDGRATQRIVGIIQQWVRGERRS